MSFYFFFLQSENISIKSHNCCYLTCSTYRTIPCGATGVINPPSINSCHKKQDRDLSYCRRATSLSHNIHLPHTSIWTGSMYWYMTPNLCKPAGHLATILLFKCDSRKRKYNCCGWSFLGDERQGQWIEKIPCVRGFLWLLLPPLSAKEN